MSDNAPRDVGGTRPDAGHRRIPEWYIVDERAARLVAAFFAAVLVVAAVVWMRAAMHLFDPPSIVCDGCAEDWFRRTQLALAIVGVVITGVACAYLLHVAATGRTWRRRGAVSTALAIAVLAWSGLVVAVAWS